MKTLNHLLIHKVHVVISMLPILMLINSCKTKFYDQEASTPAPSQGSADFSSYVAVGTNITAGYADSALYSDVQNVAYPNLLAAKFKQANGNLNFNQPDINNNTGWSSTSGGKSVGKLLLTYQCDRVTVGGVAQNTDINLGSFPAYSGDVTTIGNLAVPFLTIDKINTVKLTSAAKSTDPELYYRRIVNESSTLGIASEAKKRNAKFFSVWLGYLDVLNFASSGGTKPLISADVFRNNLKAVLDSLTSVPGSKGVVANIPYVYLFPKITNNTRRLTSTTDPARNPVYLTQAQADLFNSSLKTNAFTGNQTNNYAIQTGTGAIRQLSFNSDLSTIQDYIVTSAVLDNVGLGQVDPDSVRKCKPNYKNRDSTGFVRPIANSAVLDVDEIAILKTEIDTWNNIIAELVNSYGGRVALVDLNAFYTTLTLPSYGIVTSGSNLIGKANHPNLGPDFGSFFSLDRAFPSPRGQALLANEFIKAINSNFGATLGLYNPDDYRANIIPNYPNQ